MANTFVPVTLTACLVKSEEFLGTNRQWRTCNSSQERFMADYFAPTRDQLACFTDDELQTLISWDHNEGNEFLTDRGFPGKFKPLDPDTFLTAAVMKVLAKWLVKGVAHSVTHQGTQYPGFNIKEGVSVVTADCHEYPIVRIATQSNDVVYATIHDELKGFEMDRRIREVQAAVTPNCRSEISHRNTSTRVIELVSKPVL